MASAALLTLQSTILVSNTLVMMCRVLFLAIFLVVTPANAFQRVVQTSHNGYHQAQDGYRTASRLEQRRLPMTTTLEEHRLVKRLYSSRRRPSTAIAAAVKFRNFEEMLENFQDKPVLVSFHTRWCGPCKLMKKELRAVRDEIGDAVHVFAVDTEKWPSVSARYNVAGLPTVVIFYQGRILYRVEGVETAENLVHRVRTLI